MAKATVTALTRKAGRSAKVVRADGTLARVVIRSGSGKNATQILRTRAAAIEKALGEKSVVQKSAKRRVEQPRVQAPSHKLIARRTSSRRFA